MFKSKFIISTIIFFFLLIATSIIKNQTRITEKRLYKLTKKISLKEKDFNETQLDFHFLTSPSRIEKRIKILGRNNYLPIKNSNIFLSLTDFKDMHGKISIFKNQNEKKTKKN